jgi:chloramphenicol-sensitive protein RarD
VSRDTRAGVIAAGGAFLIWGITPIYWKLLQHVSPVELLAHRIVWALLLVAGWMTLRRRWSAFTASTRRPRTVVTLLASTACVAVNWGLFIWAVNTGRVLSTSLGYFINPLVSVLLGLVVLRERLNQRQWVAVILAALAVATLTARLGRLPWISLALALSFGFYGLLRKTVAADAVVGLCFETALLKTLSIAFLVWRDRLGVGAFGHEGPGVDLLLVAAGAVTAVPLILFTLGARRLPLSTVGVLQYIAPTCTFLLAVFLYSEPFTAAHGVAFALIWTALAIYSVDLRSRLRRLETV